MIAESIADFKLSIHKPNKEDKGENANNHFAVQAITPIARKDIVPTIFLCFCHVITYFYHIGLITAKYFTSPISKSAVFLLISKLMLHYFP